MITELRPYPAYKPSGIEWLGEVPAHWDVRRLQTAASILNGATPSTGKEEYWYGDILWITPEDLGALQGRRITDSARKITVEGHASCGTSLAAQNSIVISTRAPIGHLGILSSTACTNQGCKLLVPQADIAPEYLFDVLESARSELQSRGQGTTFAELSRAKLGSFRLSIPPLPEQIAIARFLNHAADRIDRYIRAKEKLIALLEEQRQVLVHDVVTGRIDARTGKPYPEYKPSGVKWLGDMPTHWQLVRNGRLFGQRTEVGYSELPILEVSLVTGVRVRDFENSNRKQVMSDRSMYKRAVKGDIAYNMMRMWQGAVGVVPLDGLVSPAYIVAKPLTGTEPRYFDHLFRTRAYMTEVDKFSRGIVKDRNRLYWEDFKKMPTPRPPLSEQVWMADAIDRIAELTSVGIRSLQLQIDMANEYRTRLIADVVTGKLDIREAAAEMPESNPIADEGGNETVQAQFNPLFSNSALGKETNP